MCLVYINTLMIQCVLAEPSWLERMEAEDFRALTLLLYRHVNPYGMFRLDMDTRLPIDPIQYQWLCEVTAEGHSLSEYRRR